MMLRSDYDNRLAGGVGGAKAGAANGKIIICKHDSKLKRPNIFQKSLLDEQKFVRFEGQTHLRTCSVATECLFFDKRKTRNMSMTSWGELRQELGRTLGERYMEDQIPDFLDIRKQMEVNILDF